MVDKNKRPKIICVLKSGGEYTVDHAYRLWRQLHRNITQDVEFVCLTDLKDISPNAWITKPLTDDLPGWWSKIELYKIPGPCLYFDLDTTIHGNIDNLVDAACERGLITLRDFNPRDRMVQSSVMAWNGDVSEMYRSFCESPAVTMDHFKVGGDQEFVEYCWKQNVIDVELVFWQTILPNVLVSHKKHCRNGLPPGATVEVFHGKPRPWGVAV